MQYGLAIPDTVAVPDLVQLSQEAEATGWDGIFYWDGGMVDPWVALTAVAVRTERIRLGTMVTPLPRQQPWKVASEAATLDTTSGGRVTLPVGLGVVDFEKMGITKDYEIRAKMLDEGLEIIDHLWSGQPFKYEGTYYQIEETVGLRPAQLPRIPIWVVGGSKESQIRRAALWDGAMIQGTAAEIRERKAAIELLRTSLEPLEIVTEGESPGDNPVEAASIVRAFADAGITWWIEAIWNTPREHGGLEGMRRRINQGPPRIN
jgi:alkanesulfonate monooxygenase SsuD/methylene tetrahydromethanopterin reductase-like flavin-dependent oxidoreductase (luciferase family)